MDEKPPIALPQISGFLTWIESLITLISGPMLTVGGIIALVDLLTDGALQVNVPWILYLWAISQAIGVDGQLIGSAAKSARMAFEKRWPSFLFEFLLMALLGYIALLATIVFGYQQTFHLTTTQALARLGMDSVSWLWQRSAVAVFLIMLSGWRRFIVKRHVALAVELAEIEREKTLTQAKQELRAVKLKGMIGTVKAGVNTALNRKETPEEPAPDDEANTDTVAEETPEKPIIKTAGLPKGMIDKHGLKAWAKRELGRDLSDDEATDIIMASKDKQRHLTAQGQPYIASAASAKSLAKRRYPAQVIRLVSDRKGSQKPTTLPTLNRHETDDGVEANG